MRWERRKPLWPIVAALGLLFVLALVAPRSWQGDRSRQRPTVAQPLPIELPLELVEPPLAIHPPQPQPRSGAATTTVESLSPSVLIMPAESLPVVREFNLQTLLSLRDMVLAIIDQSPNLQPPTAPEATAPTATDTAISRSPQVRVSNENQRLAMVPRRVPDKGRQSIGEQPAIGKKPTVGERPAPALPAEVTAEDVAGFAAILLEAANGPEPKQVAQEVEPRLALRPTPSEGVEVTVRPEPPLAESELNQLPRIEPSLLRHRPLALVEQLESFSASSSGAVWSQQVLTQLRLLIEEGTAKHLEVNETLDQLERLAKAGVTEAENPANTDYRNQWQQAAQALGRRLVIWRLLLDPKRPMISGESQTSTTLLPVLSEVATLLEEAQNGNDWREYLLLDRIAAATSEGIGSAPLKRTKLAQKVLARMTDRQLTAEQRDFLATAPLVELQQELQPWAAGKVNLETLAALVERYEAGREMRFAAAIAQLQQRLKWSEDPSLQALAAHIEQHYRGANMRIAMSDDLLNRMMPKQEPVVTPVRERIAGAKVRGSARTTTTLRVRLMPDSDAWHFGLEASGNVYSKTRSDTWPARIRNAAKLQYNGRKEISIDESGLRVWPAQAQARGRNELLGVDSQLDPIPILGHLLRDLARQKHSKSRPMAISQAKSKVVRQVKKRMNETTDRKLKALEQKFRDKVLAPIQRLALLAEPLDMHTTNQRAVMQLRFANIGQLAAHTLRPLAPSDSVLSLQMHETALNNAMMGLGLSGRRMTLAELFEFFAQRFGQPEALPPDDLPRGAAVEFAARDTFRVQCDGDRLELILNIAELAHRRDKIKNFQVHVHFRPVLSGLEVRLVRDGALQFSGRRLKTGPRVVLHSVIGKLLKKDQEIRLTNVKLLDDPRLAGLMVTQLVIEDGWIGLALGPAYHRRTAWRASLPEVLSTHG